MIKRLTFTIPEVPRTKKNSSRIINRKLPNGKLQPMVIPSKAFTEYQEACGWHIKGKGLKIGYPVNVKCVYYMPTRRRVDLVNLIEATMDILVHYEVLKDDDCKIVVGHDGSRVYHDKTHPRCEIVIEAVEEKPFKEGKRGMNAEDKEMNK